MNDCVVGISGQGLSVNRRHPLDNSGRQVPEHEATFRSYEVSRGEELIARLIVPIETTTGQVHAAALRAWPAEEPEPTSITEDPWGQKWGEILDEDLGLLIERHGEEAVRLRLLADYLDLHLDNSSDLV